MKEQVDFEYGVVILKEIFEDAINDAKWLKTDGENLVTDKFLDLWDNKYSKSEVIAITNENVKDVNILLNYMILCHKNIEFVRQIYKKTENMVYFNLLEQKHTTDENLIVEISKKLAETFNVFNEEAFTPNPDIAETLYTINRL